MGPTSFGIACLMASTGRLAEAEDLMTRAVQDAAEECGPDSPEWATVQSEFGVLLPLAGLLLQCGDARQAAAVAGEAVDNLQRNGHDRLNDLLVLRAVALHSAGDGEPFPGLDTMPDDVVEEVAELMITQNHDAGLIPALADALKTRLGPDHRVTRQVHPAR
jgi:hypothetical protein